ncbi:hypothetical protein D9M71_560900 [compost metagenome]
MAEHRVAAIARLGTVLQAADVHHAHFTHQGQAFSAHDLVEEVRQGGLELGDFLAAVAVQVFARGGLKHRRVGEHSPAQRTNPGKQQVLGVQLHWGVGTITDLALPGGTAVQGGGEAQAVQANIFRVLHEVTGIGRDRDRLQGGGCAGKGRAGGVERRLAGRGGAEKW